MKAEVIRMKRTIAFILSILMILSLAACAAPSAPVENTAPPKEESTPPAESAPPAKDDAPAKPDKQPKPSAAPTPAPNTEITELYTLEGEYTDSWGYSYTYSYHVPQFADDSEDARELNREIAERYVPMAEEEVAAMEEGYSPVTLSIDWDACCYRENIVFLVITAENDWGGSEYMVCAYDAAKRDDLDFEDIAALAGYSEDALLAAIRTAAEEAFAASMDPGMLDERYYNEMRDWTLSEENINDDTRIYMDADGQLYAIVAIAVPAGAGWYYSILQIG